MVLLFRIERKRGVGGGKHAANGVCVVVTTQTPLAACFVQW